MDDTDLKTDIQKLYKNKPISYPISFGYFYY